MLIVPSSGNGNEYSGLKLVISRSSSARYEEDWELSSSPGGVENATPESLAVKGELAAAPVASTYCE